jgi:hypothetical protein
MKQRVLITFLVICALVWSCQKQTAITTPGNIAPDELEVFEIDNSTDTTLYTADEIIIYLPANSVVHEDGTPVDQYEIRMAGFMDAAEAMSSNLTTTTQESLLNSSAIIYSSLTSNGNTLQIDPDKPITMDIPDYYDRESLVVYEPDPAIDEDIVWKKTSTPTFLSTLDFDLLDFLPEGFQSSAKNTLGSALPPEAIDSVYYAMEAYEQREVIKELAYGTEQSEFLYTVKKEVAVEFDSTTEFEETEFRTLLTPATIKVLRNPRFRNTFIATRAFEQRLKTLHKVHCYGVDLLETYLLNLHEPLWVSDSIIFFHNKFDHPLLYDFEKFYKSRNTNVRNAPESSSALFEWFVQELDSERNNIQKEQQNTESKALKNLRNVLGKRERFLKRKKTLLKKREAYRMKRFGFEMTSTGWYNFAIPAKPEELEKFILDVTVENGNSFQRTYAFVVNPKIFSLYAMSSENKVLFEGGFEDDRHLLMWKNQEAIVTAIGKDKHVYAYDRVDWIVRKENHIELTLKELSFPSLQQTLKKLPLKKRENKITVSLRLDEKLAKQDSLLLIELDKQLIRQTALRRLYEKAHLCEFVTEAVSVN